MSFNDGTSEELDLFDSLDAATKEFRRNMSMFSRCQAIRAGVYAALVAGLVLLLLFFCFTPYAVNYFGVDMRPPWQSEAEWHLSRIDWFVQDAGYEHIVRQHRADLVSMGMDAVPELIEKAASGDNRNTIENVRFCCSKKSGATRTVWFLPLQRARKGIVAVACFTRHSSPSMMAKHLNDGCNMPSGAAFSHCETVSPNATYKVSGIRRCPGMPCRAAMTTRSTRNSRNGGVHTVGQCHSQLPPGSVASHRPTAG